MTLNIQELQALLVFLNRTQLTGNESMAHAQLVDKIQKALEGASRQQLSP